MTLLLVLAASAIFGTSAAVLLGQADAQNGKSAAGPGDSKSAAANDSPGMVHLQRAKIAEQKSTNQEALREYRLALEAEPDNLDIRMTLGSFLTRTNDLQSARAVYAEGTQRHPDNADLHNDYGVVLMMSGEADPAAGQEFEQRARDQFDKALQLDPRHVPSLVERGLAESRSQAQALVLAGLTADGETTVLDPHHVERGYADLPGKLRALGADVQRA